MKLWLRRNWLAFAVIALTAGLIAGTITYPEWTRQIGFKRPEQIVPAGQWADVHGARWRLTPITIPAADPSASFNVDDQPAGSRLVSYLLDREQDGKPAGVPEGFQFCLPSIVDGTRRWTKTAIASRVFRFAMNEGYATICMDDGPYLIAAYVPEDAEVSAVEVLLQPGEADTDEEIDENAPVYESYDEPPVVIRFLTD